MTSHHEEVEFCGWNSVGWISILLWLCYLGQVPCRFAVSTWEISELLSCFASAMWASILALFVVGILQAGIFGLSQKLRRDANNSIRDRLNDDERLRILKVNC